MKLLRFNQEPVDISPTDITAIDAGEGVLRVILNNDIQYVGYHLQRQ